MQVGIHTRIGKGDEAEGLGVARQEEDCRPHCAARGREAARVYEDNDLSAYGRRTVRPEFRQIKPATNGPVFDPADIEPVLR
ncbi:hypothetical protein ABZ517_33705 [Streptomyces scabiei]|uniref:hypothetical protein n=1 Tax=Streptomyces scabiei TaxID=1930 RepID=UPI0033FF70B7